MLVGAVVLRLAEGGWIFCVLCATVFFFFNMSVKLELTGPRVSVLIKELEPSGVSGQCGVALDYVVAAVHLGSPTQCLTGMQLDCLILLWLWQNTVKGHENS